MKYINFKSNEYYQSETEEKKVNIWVLLIIGLFIGFINGFWGGGGGMICVPTLTFILGLKEKQAHATTILIMLPLSCASFIVYLVQGSIEMMPAISISIGFVIGGVLGAMLLNKLNNVVLQFIFSLLIIWGGIKLLF